MRCDTGSQCNRLRIKPETCEYFPTAMLAAVIGRSAAGQPVPWVSLSQMFFCPMKTSSSSEVYASGGGLMVARSKANVQ